MSVARYEINLKEFEDEWGTNYPKVVEYCKKQWLRPHKERFVYAFTYDYKHFKLESTSMVEQAHGRLKCLLFTSQNGIVTMQHAIHEYTNNDINKIKKQFQESSFRKLTEFKEDNWLLVGIHCNVSHWAIRFMMKHLKLYQKYDKPSTPCKCRIMKAIGLPCRHMLGRYKTLIPLEDIDPCCKPLSFKPAPREDPGLATWNLENNPRKVPQVE